MFCCMASSVLGGRTAEPMLCQWIIWWRRMPSMKPPKPMPRITPGHLDSLMLAASMLRQVLLNEARAEMDVQLDQRFRSNAFKAVDLARLDHQDVTRAGLEFLPVHDPAA